MTRYFVKAPVSGWHEVDREKYERFIEHIKENATPTIPIEEIINKRTKILEETP